MTSAPEPATRGVGSGPRLALSTACLSGTLEDKLGAAAAAGFSTIELLANDLVMAAWTPREVRAEAARLGMSIEAYQPLHVEAVPPELFALRLRRAERIFELVHRLGARMLVLCSAMSVDGVDDDDLAAAQLHALAERSASHGVRLAYEPVPWGRVAAYEHAARLVEVVDHPNLGLCLDSFHLLSRDNDSATVADIPASKIFHVQLADAPRPHLQDRAWSLHHRAFPGQGALDLVGFMRRLLAADYAGPIALEIFNDVYQQEDPRHAATGAMRSMLALSEAVSSDSPGGDAGLFSVSIPPAPAVGGFAFAELALDAVSAPVITRALASLGFAATGQHRSKPVQLWQQGGARVLLNLAPQRAIAPATAAICALGVETPDPAGFASRAGRLMAPQLVRLRAPDEFELECVAAPDGTALFFCDSDHAGGWLQDFESLEVPTATATHVTAIDHVSLTESIDDFDQTALFYRSVLGLASAQTSEATAPFGQVRTWAARDAQGRLRISFSTAPLRRGDWAPMVSSPHHIAFASDDVVASARQLRGSDVPLLEIPSNYYDDLDARFDLPSELLDTMRELFILYDRDDEGGEFLHFFTEMLGSRVFFSVVQRIGDYQSYGAPNSMAVRMAAHRRQRLRMVASAPVESHPDDRHEYSLAHLTALSLSPPDLVDAAAAAGYRYVGLRLTKVTMEEPHYPLIYDPALMRATKTHLAATGVEVLDVELARLTSGDNPRDYLRFLEAGAELGARHVITQLPDADFERKVDRFGELCQLALPLGLTIDLEFPSWTETGSLREATQVMRAADQPNAGLLVDLLHFARSSSSVSELRELPREWFHFVHVCDAPAEIPSTTEELIHTARFERLFPGEGGIDTQGILAALPHGIPYALEIPRARLAVQVGAKEHARLAIEATRRHLDAPQQQAG